MLKQDLYLLAKSVEKIVKHIPFVANWDETHCFQACLSMVLQQFLPEQTLDYGEIERITGKSAGKTTWYTQALLYLIERGFEVICQTDFDFQSFIDQKETYLYERFGREIGRVLIKFSDIPKEIYQAQQLLSRLPLSPKIPNTADIIQAVADGYLVICFINWCKLNQEIGYEPHFLLIYDIEDKIEGLKICCHDPGPPAIAARQIPIEQFDMAWSSPTIRDRNLIAVKYVN